MQKMKWSLLGFLFLLIFTNVSYADPSVYLYVDTAPNAYGSPNYESWLDNAYAAASEGTFMNMQNSINAANAGTTNFEIQDEVVYSFGDLGHRLHWVYWIPDETINSLTGNFEIKLENYWDGEYSDFYLDYYGSTWLEPTKWEEYDSDGDGTADGVIGTAGMAWWGAYGVDTQEALDADLAAWGTSEESWVFTVKLNGEEYSLTSNRTPVPEPATMLLLGSGLIGLAGLRKKIKK